jgi:hypothetical protein
MQGKCIGTSVFIASAVIGSTTYAIPSVPTISFTGSSTLTSYTATSTDPLNVGDLTFPETDSPTVTDQSDGFAVSGRFDFLNGPGTSAEVVITAYRPVNISGFVYTSSSEDGQFGIFSTDTGLISTMSTTDAVNGTLDNFSAQTYLASPSAQAVSGTSVTAADPGGESVPVDSAFPTGSYESIEGPVATGPITASGSYLLEEVVTVDISGLLPLEAVDIQLPTTATVDFTPVPEPSPIAALCIPIGIGLLFRRGRSRQLA